jgi:RNA polymerase sigma-70 factor (ECF subfamily)
VYNFDGRVNDWLAAAGAGDEQAAEAIFRRFSPAVFRLAMSLLNDAEDADEVMQDTFVYALRNIRRYDPAKSAFQTWLFTIAISRCRNKRRRKWLPSVAWSWFMREETTLSPVVVRSVEDWLAARGIRQGLWLAVQNLSPNLREALILRYVGDLAYAEIGEAVGCGSKAAESRVRTAVGTLRKRFMANGEQAGDWLDGLAESNL